jgi:CelD/BcsL family acetyltransferase involved in cellulose biosynthesis
MLSSARKDWNRLSDAAEFPNVFTTYDWFQAWYRRFVREDGHERRPNVFVLKRNGEITGISPLIRMVSSHFGLVLRRLQFVARVWDYNDLVLGEDTASQTDAVVEYLAHNPKEWDVLDLRDLRDTGNIIARIETALARAELPYCLLPEEERCPYMPITGPWSDVMNRHSRTTRREFRRFTEMLREGLQMRVIENPQEVPGLLDKLIALESQKHVDGELAAPLLGIYPEVFQSLFDTLGPRGWITVVLLEREDCPVAWHLLYRCGKKLWGCLTAYDHTASRLSPGTMLIPAVIDYGFERGFEEFDFLSGEEPYKMRWTTGFHRTYRLLVWNRRVMSRVRKAAYYDVKNALHRTLHRNV